MKQIIITVADDKMAAIIACIASEVLELHVTTVTPPPRGRLVATPGVTRQTKGTTPIEKTRLGIIALEALAQGPLTAKEVGAIMAAKGFAAGSGSPVTSKLRAAGFIEELPDRKFGLARPTSGPVT